jgi:hypothetical protein
MAISKKRLMATSVTAYRELIRSQSMRTQADTGGTILEKPVEAAPLSVTANRLGAFRFRLVLAMIASYLAMMAFLIYSARNATQTAVIATDFSPAMVALGSCMAFSVALTGLFVVVRHGD